MPPPRSLLSRQLRAAAVLLLFLGAVGAAGFGVYRMTVVHPTLEGERRHVFETVELSDDAVVLEHTFVLRNRLRRAVEIQQVTASCGCTTAEPSTRTVAPGAAVEIATTLRLNHEGLKRAHVNVVYGGTDLDTLYLEGSARLASRLRAYPIAGSEPGGPPDVLILYIDYDTNDPPPDPQLALEPGVGAEFAGWELVEPVRPSVGTPARWRGRVRLAAPAGGALPESPFALRVGDRSVDVSLAAP
jgi:hypothetical protein